MAIFGSEKKCNCTAVAIVASLIVGIITAFLRITAVITLTPAFLWVLFGIAVLYLAVAFLAAFLSRRTLHSECVSNSIATLLIGILGTILLSVVLLAVEFAATSIIGAIITGLLLLFFSLTVTSTACLVKCQINHNN